MSDAGRFEYEYPPARFRRYFKAVAAALAVACAGFIVAAVLTEGGPYVELAWLTGVIAAVLATELRMEGSR